MNIGDLIFQLVPLLLLTVIIFAAVAGLRTLKKRKAQLERIEKLDTLSKEEKQNL